MPFSVDVVSHPINSLTVGGSFAVVVSFTPDGRFVLFRTAASSIAPVDNTSTTNLLFRT